MTTMKKEKDPSPLKTIIKQARELVKIPIVIGVLVTPVRFSLELLGLPENNIFIIGVLWVTIGYAIWWGVKYYDHNYFPGLLLMSLLIFSPVSRISVALAWWVETKWALGTHYGLYFNTFGEALWNQVVYGTLVQLIPGFLAGCITWGVMLKIKTWNVNKNTVKNG